MESKWEVGKKYLRVDGSVVTVIWTEEAGKYPLVALESCGDVVTFSAAGLYYPPGTNERDLTTEEYKEPVYLWINVYENNLMCWNTKEMADQCARTEDRIGLIKINIEDSRGRYDKE